MENCDRSFPQTMWIELGVDFTGKIKPDEFYSGKSGRGDFQKKEVKGLSETAVRPAMTNAQSEFCSRDGQKITARKCTSAQGDEIDIVLRKANEAISMGKRELLDKARNMLVIANRKHSDSQEIKELIAKIDLKSLKSILLVDAYSTSFDIRSYQVTIDFISQNGFRTEVTELLKIVKSILMKRKQIGTEEVIASTLVKQSSFHIETFRTSCDKKSLGSAKSLLKEAVALSMKKDTAKEYSKYVDELKELGVDTGNLPEITLS